MSKLGGGKSKMVAVIVLVVLAVICIAGVAAFVKKPHGKKPVKQPVVLGPSKPVELGEMIVNLADPGECRYAKADIVVLVTGDVGKEQEEELKSRMRDAAIEVIGTNTLSNLLKSDGKAVLKKEIVKAVNENLAEGGEEGSESKNQVVKVYFNEFVMQ